MNPMVSICTLALAFAFAVSAAPLDKWLWSNPLPQGNALLAVAHGNGRFVAVGEFGTILTSPDGTNWTSSNSGTFELLNDCTYGDGQFVAVGHFGTILTSPDGGAWTPQFGGTFYSLNAVAFGNGQYVAVGDESTILTSPDAITWIQRATGPVDLADVAHGEGVWVAVGGYTIVTSTNGSTWVRRDANLASAVGGITHADGKFVAVGGSADWNDDFRNVVAVSDDAQTWTASYFQAPERLRRTVFHNGQWAAVAANVYQDPYNYYASGSIYMSANLTDWTLADSNAGPVFDVIFAGNHFLAVSFEGSVVLSSDGTNWRNPTAASLDVPYAFQDLEFVGGSFVGVALDRLIFSPDGMTWTNTHIFTTNFSSGSFLYSIAYGKGRYVAGGDYQRLWTSTNARDWTQVAPELDVKPYVADVAQIIFANDRFLGVPSYQGNLLTSTNGLDWSVQSLRTNFSDYFYSAGVAYGSGVYVVMGDDGQFAVSPNLSNWGRVLPPQRFYLTSITHGNGRFVAVGSSGILSSTDGTNWLAHKSEAFGELQDVTFGAGCFVAGGTDSELSPITQRTVWVSTNGVDWTVRNLDTTRSIFNVAYGADTFVLAGSRSTIMRSALSVPRPTISLSALAAGRPVIVVHGIPGRWYRLECSSALSPLESWHPMATLFNTNGAVIYTDTNTANQVNRFYRAAMLP